MGGKGSGRKPQKEFKRLCISPSKQMAAIIDSECRALGWTRTQFIEMLVRTYKQQTVDIPF